MLEYSKITWKRTLSISHHNNYYNDDSIDISSTNLYFWYHNFIKFPINLKCSFAVKHSWFDYDSSIRLKYNLLLYIHILGFKILSIFGFWFFVLFFLYNFGWFWFFWFDCFLKHIWHCSNKKLKKIWAVCSKEYGFWVHSVYWWSIVYITVGICFIFCVVTLIHRPHVIKPFQSV